MILDFGKMSSDDMKIIHEEADTLFKLPFLRSSISHSYPGAIIDGLSAFADNTRTSLTFFPKKKMIPKIHKVVSKKIELIYGEEYSKLVMDCQFLKYQVGQKFDWHYDHTTGAMPIRILTFSMNLNSGWGDGGLEVKYLDEVKTMGTEEGDFCIFLTDLKHRAVAPTIGERHAITFWVMGEEKLLTKLQDIHYERKMEKLKEKAL